VIIRLLFIVGLIFLFAPGIHAQPAYQSSESCASANTNTCTPTATVVGDSVLVFAFRSGSTTAPSCGTTPTFTCPSGSPWTGSGGSGSTSASWRVGYYKWTGTSQTCGTWTNAGNVVCLSFYGANTEGGVAGMMGAHGTASVGASSTLTCPSVSLSITNGTSIVVCFGGSRTATNVQVCSSMTTQQQSGTTAMVAGGNTAGVSSFSSCTFTMNASTEEVGVTFEIEAAPSEPSCTPGVPCILQTSFNSTSCGGTSTCASGGFVYPLTTGSFIIACVGSGSTGAAGSPPFTDSASLTYADAGPGLVGATATGECGCAPNSTTTKGDIVTSHEGNDHWLGVSEVANIQSCTADASGSTADGSSTSGTTNNVTSGSATPNVSGDLVISFINANTGPINNPGTSPVSFTTMPGFTQTFGWQYAVYNSTSAINPTNNDGAGSGDDYTGITLLYKATAGATVPLLTLMGIG